ncbi:MAG: hypothetical protein IJZ44_01905 [Lachnospiraceae bacterium]|nr:hypothetical protein [Lachnospiraceae bacterium]
MKTSTKNVIIAGCFTILAAILSSYITAKFQSAKTEIILTTAYNENEAISEQYTTLENSYTELLDKNTELEKRNNTLSSQNTSLNKEIETLEDELSQKNSQLQSLEDTLDSYEQNEPIEDKSATTSDTTSSQKTVSIFDLDTFRGEGRWQTVNSIETFTIDTYDNKYPLAYYASHAAVEKDNLSFVPTYLLDNQYTTCEGQIAWSKYCKNLSGNIWIDFYSGDTLIYTVGPMSATDRAISFSFSVEGLETLTIVRNSDRSAIHDDVYAIYPYLRLLK